MRLLNLQPKAIELHLKSTRKTAPVGVKTQGQCSGHELCNNGNCRHQKSWWFGKERGSGKVRKGRR